MLPAGYLAKRVIKRPDCLRAPRVIDIYSMSGCISEIFDDYVDHWKHNGFWLFDTPEIIKSIAAEDSIDLTGTTLFYYEVYEKEFAGNVWRPHGPDPSFKTSVIVPAEKRLEGFDVVTFYCGNTPECSPLSCNHLAESLPVNSHCLFESFDEAEARLKIGAFTDSEPGPYRIFSVYSTAWPEGKAT